MKLGFQEPATAVMEGIIELHNNVMYYIIIVVVLVSWVLYSIVEDHREQTAGTRVENRKEVLGTIGLVHGKLLEIVWTVTPSLVLVAIGIPSFGLLYAMDELIEPGMTIKALGHQWYWSYEFTDVSDVDVGIANEVSDSYMVPEEDLFPGEARLLTTDIKIYLPTNVHIRLIVTAADVLHAWAVPAMGIKIDAVPGRLNQMGLYMKREGRFFGQCSELCGVNHGFMPIEVVAGRPTVQR
jgi:cytochrome c oxidase subunit 2